MRQEISGFDGWVFNFDKEGQLTNKEVVNEVREHFRKHFESSPDRTQHLFVFVHGVNTDFDEFRDYIEWFSRLYEQYLKVKPPIDREDITILGVKWQSQEMAEMLKLLLSYEERPMPAQTLAEKGLKDAIHETTREHRTKVRVHLTAHSMGAQVLLYLLPQLAPDVEIGSMLFLQGFAPSSAFGGPVAEQKASFQKEIRETVNNRTLNRLYGPLKEASTHLVFDLPHEGKVWWWLPPTWDWVRDKVNDFLRSTGAHPLPWGIDLDLEVKKLIDPKVDQLTANFVKVTDFDKHLEKVKGPILATTTRTLWTDYQVGLAEISFYSPCGVVGVRGFQRADVQNSDLHDVGEDEIEGGNAAYDFVVSDKGRFFNLRADPYCITDHDDFKNRAIAYAHLRAAGVIDKNVIERARNDRCTAPTLSPIQNPEIWMQETWNRIGERTLTQLCLPGSHDSGMGMLTDVLAPSEACVMELVRGYITEKAHAFTDDDTLTQIMTSGAVDHVTRTAIEMARVMMPRLCMTQTSPIREQLRNGCRLFDLRPAWWHNAFYLAHGDHQTFPRAGGKQVDLGYIGGIGESLEETLGAVASFASEKAHGNSAHSRELIVLKFSHAADWADPNRAFTVERKQDLFKTIRRRLGDVMINSPEPSGRVDDIPLKELMKEGKTVLCIYEQALYDKALKSDDLIGAYWYGSADGDGPKINYRLYDEYANSRNLAYVIGDQWWKFRTQMEASRKDKASGQVFLLSWTATLTPGPAVMDMRSIIDNAQVLNARLQSSMKNWIRRGDISGAARPNILYVDAYDAKVLDTVAMINAVELRSKT